MQPLDISPACSASFPSWYFLLDVELQLVSVSTRLYLEKFGLRRTAAHSEERRRASGIVVSGSKRLEGCAVRSDVLDAEHATTMNVQ